MRGMDRGDTESSALARAGWGFRDRLRRSTALRRLVVANRHRGLRPADTFIASYPRSGNTWLRFVLADLVSGRAVDFEEVERLIPNVGNQADAPQTLAGGGRMIKTHEAYRPEYRRGVYLYRDARDVLVSWYRVTRADPTRLDDLHEFAASFTSPEASPYGAWHDHVRSWLTASESNPGIRTYQFEALRADPVRGIAEVAEFCGIPASKQQISEALDRNTAADMSKREESNREFLQRSFGRMSVGVREGRSGNWRGVLDEEHMRELAPALALNDELGYSDS
jgi:hypothetical protein